jgi:hypothetical protein
VKSNIACSKNGFFLIISLFSLAALVISGCNSGYIMNVGFSKDYKLKNTIYPSVEVDIIGTTPRTDQLVSKYPVNVYFEPNNLANKDMPVYKMYFSEEDYNNKQLSSDDPIWDKWNSIGIINLYVLANLPEIDVKATKLKDMRKIKIPFDPSWKASTINIELRSNGLFIANKKKLQN